MTGEHHEQRASASALARCVGDIEDFRPAWGERAWIHHGTGYTDLLDETAIDELLTTRGLRTPFLRVAQNGSTLPERSFTSGGGVGATIDDQLDDARLARLFADGATIVLQALHRTWDPITRFVADLADDLGHPVQANAYITPPQSQGFSAHYDVHDVFVLQLSGEKRWIIHEPVLTWPMRDEPWDSGGRRQAVAAAAEREPVLDVVLRPGDCLYLPRGYLHAATALGGVSAHLTLGIHTWTRHHLATETMRRALATATGLRAPLPLGADVGAAEDLAADADAVRAALVAAVKAVSDADLAAIMAGRADASGRAEPVSPLAQAAATRTIDATTAVRLRSHLRLRRAQDESGVRLRGRGVDVHLPAADAALLDPVLDGRTWTATALAEAGPATADTDAALRLIGSLVRDGVLVPA